MTKIKGRQGVPPLLLQIGRIVQYAEEIEGRGVGRERRAHPAPHNGKLNSLSSLKGLILWSFYWHKFPIFAHAPHSRLELSAANVAGGMKVGRRVWIYTMSKNFRFSQKFQFIALIIDNYFVKISNMRAASADESMPPPNPRTKSIF